MSVRLKTSQIRGARGMLDWTIVDLARAAGLSISTIKRIECPENKTVSDEVHAMVRAAFEAAGAGFFGADGGTEVGVSLRDPR